MEHSALAAPGREGGSQIGLEIQASKASPTPSGRFVISRALSTYFLPGRERTWPACCQFLANHKQSAGCVTCPQKHTKSK